MQAVKEPTKSEPDVRMIPLEEIAAVGNIRQTDDKELRESGLVDSIREQGVIEPVLVRPWVNEPGVHDLRRRDYELVLGFRRYRASQLAGVKAIKAEVKVLSTIEVREVQLVENLQRKDLSAMEEAAAFRAYLATTKTSQGQLAKKIGKSQPYISNRIRLLELRPEIQDHIRRGMLTASHGEVLLKIPKEASGLQGELARKAVEQKWDVRAMQSQLLWEVDSWEREKEAEARFAAYLKKAKHPDCPTCKKPGVEQSYYIDNGLECEDGHVWSGASGKLVTYRGGGVVQQRAERRDPRDMKESPVIRDPRDLYTILKAIVLGVDPKELRAIHYGNEYGVGPFELTIRLQRSPIAGLGMEAVSHDYSTGERTEIRLENTFDSARRRKMKAAFHAWARKHLPRVAVKKGTPPPVDATVLDGSVDDVVRRLPSGKRNLERLELLRALEAKGKARNGVFEAIDLRISNATEGVGL